MKFHDHPKPVNELSAKEVLEVMAKAHSDFHYFCEVILGYWDMNEEHQELCRFLTNPRRRKKMVLTPRYTFKSCIATQGMALWWIINNPDIRILIYSDTSEKAENFLCGLKNHIEGKVDRSRFREFFGNLVPTRAEGAWNRNNITVSTRKSYSPEPTVDSGGIDTTKTGKHYDAIIYDDIVSKNNSTTKTLMDKVFDLYNESLALLKPKGNQVIVGTRWNMIDTYGRLIEKNKKFDDLDIFIRDAESVDIDGNLIYANMGLDREHLDSLKDSMGTYTYACLMRNNPVSSDDAIFLKDNFKFYGYLQESDRPLLTGKYDFLYVTATIDPAGKGDDFTGGTVVGTDFAMKMYILNVIQRKMTIEQIVEWVFKMNLVYKLRKLGVETNFYQGLLEKEIRRRMQIEQDSNPNFHMFGVESFNASQGRFGENKFMRMLALQAKHQRQEILLPFDGFGNQKQETQSLIHQMLQLTPTHMPEPNDALDALAWQMRIIHAGGVVKKDEVQKGTIAWLEKKMIDNHNQMQKRLPRRLRKMWQPGLNRKAL